MPTVVVHADWSANPEKRWMAIATLSEERDYWVEHPNLVGDPATLLQRLGMIAGKDGTVFLGFDFPIGLPLKYAEKVGVDDFLILLPNLGRGKWEDFFSVAEVPEEISLSRPFYPKRPGGKKQVDLINALRMNDIEDLRRKCDLAHSKRRAASPLFWTLGAQQVGKAAISGWKDVLTPATRADELNLAIWPFSGTLMDLLMPGQIIVAETYPAEIYTHLGISFSSPQAGKKSGKRDHTDRSSNAEKLLNWATLANVKLSNRLCSAIENGFGIEPRGEDLFDAAIGLFGMLNVIFGNQPPGEPADEKVRKVEGWILGQPYT